jgi:hypothetical protein
MSRYNTNDVGFRAQAFNARAFLMEWVQQTLEQYGRSGIREPTHWMKERGIQWLQETHPLGSISVQLQGGDHPGILAVEIKIGLEFGSPGSDQGHAVLQNFFAPPGHGGLEIAHKAVDFAYDVRRSGGHRSVFIVGRATSAISFSK